MTSKWLIRFVLLGTIAAGAMLWWSSRSPPEPPRKPPPTIQQIQALGTLVTTRVQVQRPVTRRLEGRLGTLVIEAHLAGEILLGPDLTRASLEVTNAQKGIAVVSLPPPSVISRRLDLSNCRILAVRYEGLWGWFPSQQVRREQEQAVWVQGEQDLAATDPAAALRASRQQTEGLLIRLGSTAGWTLTVRWTH